MAQERIRIELTFFGLDSAKISGSVEVGKSGAAVILNLNYDKILPVTGVSSGKPTSSFDEGIKNDEGHVFSSRDLEEIISIRT